MTRAYQLGMTLLEVLVALTIFTLVAAAGYSGLHQGLAVQDSLQEKQEFWQRLDSVMTLIQQDLYQARDIPPRLPVWESVAFRGANNSDAGGPGELFLFTRTNHTFFRPDQASPYLRVAYRLQDETLYRVTWPRLNVSTDSEGAEAGLLDGVTGIQLRYMDNTRQWITSWPQALNTRGPAGLPRAVELTLELQDHESYQRVFHVGAAY